MHDQQNPTTYQVRVWGMDATGHTFFENVTAYSQSDQEATLQGLTHNLNPGDVIGLQRAEKKARFRVLWIMESGPENRHETGIRLVEGQANPLIELKISPHLTTAVAAEEKRKFIRHRVSLPLEIAAYGDRGARMHTGATDVSGRGCYIESRLPLPIGTKLAITFWIESEKISAEAAVQTSDPGVGMGIEFTSLGHALQERLQAYLAKLEQEPSTLATPASGENC